jgi:hypothetical protein
MPTSSSAWQRKYVSSSRQRKYFTSCRTNLDSYGANDATKLNEWGWLAVSQ